MVNILAEHMWISKICGQNKKMTALAPMAGMTDSPFCRICREIAGSNFVIFREMVSAEAIVRQNRKTLKMCEFAELERPIVQQIFGSDPDVIAMAAEIIINKFNPDGIDINMGCPASKLTGKVFSGAALIKDHNRAANIIKALKSKKLNVPITVKTRLGWNSDGEILKFAPVLEQAGADAVIIHGRTKVQSYSGNANWKRIGDVKKILSIPVIANGDIITRADAVECFKITKSDGIMIGRGSLGNPWILKMRGLNHSYDFSNAVSFNDKASIILKHAKYHLEHYGKESIATFRKHLAWYFKKDRFGFFVPNIKEFRSRLVRIKDIGELELILEEIMAVV